MNIEKPKDITGVYSGVLKNDVKRREHDFYPTPPLPVWILSKYTNIPKKVVEPCAGVGNISIELRRCGHEVLSYDLVAHEGPFVEIISGYDALTLVKPVGYDAWITNPPYNSNLPQKIAKKGIEEYDYTAVLVRITYLEGTKRKKSIFDKTPPTTMIFFSDRICFNERTPGREPVELDENQGGMIAYVWVVWDKKHPNWGTKNTECHWVSLTEEYPEWRKNFDAKQ